MYVELAVDRGKSWEEANALKDELNKQGTKASFYFGGKKYGAEQVII